jgi:hypothetical protein
MVRIRRNFLAAHTKARAIPVLPLVGSTIEVSAVKTSPLRRLDHGHADAVFDAPQGVLKF